MTQTTLTSTEPGRPLFEEHLRSAAGGVREAILELMTSAGADPGRPQEMARRFGLRSGLTWKICKVVQASNLYSAVPHIPGSTGLKLFLDAFEKAGAPKTSVDAARAASQAFDQMVEIHTGDRQTLMTMLGHLAPLDQQAQREADRKLAFQGNSSTWGIQARLNLSAQFVAPNPAKPELIDIVGVSALVDCRRLRRMPNWVLTQFRSYNDDGTLRGDQRIPIDPAVDINEEMPLMREFCERVPETRAVEIAGGKQFELCDGPIGHTAAFSCVFGSFDRQFAGWYRDELNEHAEYPTLLYTPSEVLIADVFIHRDLPMEEKPEPHLFSCLFAGGDIVAARGDAHRMPLAERAHQLGSPPAVTTPHFPRYPQLMKVVCERLDWEAGDFRGYRFQMAYPPVPTLFTLRHALPERGE